MADPILSRADAMAQGLRSYFTGKPCKHGHIARRLVSNWTCFECNTENVRRCQAVQKNTNPEAFRAAQRRRAERHHKRHPKANAEKVARWAKRNPQRYRELFNLVTERRRARRLGASGSFTAAHIAIIMKQQDGICAGVCGGSIREKYEIDHKVPLSRGGSGDANNIQLMCRNCNARKGQRTMNEWLVGLGLACVGHTE